MKVPVLFILFLAAGLGALAQPYRKLHNQATVIDAHNDFISFAIEAKVRFENNLLGQTHTDLARLQQGGVDIQIFSVFCEPEMQQPYAYANRQIDSVFAWIERNPQHMMLVTNAAELKQAVKAKKLGAMLGVEGGHMIEDKLQNLDALHARGVRYLTLTWNNSTSWATSAKDEESAALPQKGLTPFGRQVVTHMNELGMLVDVSHAGEQTFWDVIATTTKPIIASHSCAWSLCHHRRNLKDDQIKAIAKSGGVIHLNFYAGFIDGAFEKEVDAFIDRHQPEINKLIAGGIQADYAIIMVAHKHASEMLKFSPPLSMLIDHIDYMVKLAGIDHVGLGSDFDGAEAMPKELRGVQDFPLITKALLERGYSKRDIRKILGGNFIRVMQMVGSGKASR